MPVTSYKLQIGTPVDSALAKDYMYVTPHISDGGTPINAQTVVDSAAANMRTYFGVDTEIHVKLYRDTDDRPNYPLAETILHVGSSIASAQPRELSLCLSFYSQYNRPRWRGRVYIPFVWAYRHNTNASAVGSRPTGAQIAAVIDFATVVLKPLKAQAAANWTVWSQVDKAPKDVTNYYVDDEWDIQRKRGRTPTTRTVGTVP